jgi:monoamine oxidase
MKWFTKVCLAGEPSEVSLLFFLYFLRTGGGYQRLVNITDGAQQETIVGGSQQLSECMARQLTSLGGKIALSSPVIFLNQSELTGTITAETKNRQQFTAKYCICTVPTSLAARIHYDPPVAPLRDQLTQRMPMGCVIKIIVTYKNAWWREMGYSGEIVSDQEPIGLTYDKSSHDGKMHALVCFIAGKGARRWSEKTPDERKVATLAQLERCFKTDKARHITGYYEHDWSTEEFSRGCYLNFMTPGAMSDLAHHLRKPHGRIHWAGSETATKWMAYMDGALESGRRVANDVAEKLSQSSCSRTKSKL